MFDSFAERYRATHVRDGSQAWMPPALATVPGYEQFARAYAGATFNDGIYRFLDEQSAPPAARMIFDAFPAWAGRAAPFGFDWLGRAFALEFSQPSAPTVVMFEINEGDVLLIEASFTQFHEETLLEAPDAALAESLYGEWRAANSAPLDHDSCVGFTVPLFLGGADDVSNLAVTDLEVYWSLTGQLLNATRESS